MRTRRVLAAVAAAAACLVSGRGAAAQDCPPQQLTVALSDVGAGGLHWSVAMPADLRLEGLWRTPEPVVAGGVAYVDTDGRALAVRTSDGATRWNVAAPPGPQSLLLTATAVVAVTRNRATAFDRGDGHVRWDAALQPSVNLGVYPLRGGLLAVSSTSGYVTVLDLATGRTRWRRKLQAGMDRAIADGSTIVQPTGRYLVALDGRTGKVLWSNKSRAEDLSLVDGVLLVLEPPGLTGVDVRTGRKLWHNSGVSPEAADFGGYALVSGTGDDTERLDVRTGRVLWRAKVAAPPGITVRGGVVSGEGQSQLGSLTPFVVGLRQRDGRILWKHLLDKGSDPETDGVTTYGRQLLATVFASYGGADAAGVTAWDAVTGRRLWAAYAPLQPVGTAQPDGRGGAVVLSRTTQVVCTAG